MSVPQRLTLSLFIACSLLLVGALTFWSGSADYVPLAANLNPEDEVFVREQTAPKASVEVKVRRGRDLNGSQVSAIRHIISAAVPKLRPQNVAVMDFEGRLLARFQNGDDAMSAAGDQLEART